MSTQRERSAKNLDAGPFIPEINSFALHLRAMRRSAKTIRTYAEAARWFAAEHLCARTSHSAWDQVRRTDIEAWIVWLLDR